MNLDRYGSLGHPYIRKYGIGDELTWLLAMSPLMSEVISASDCIEDNVAYKSCYELHTSSMLLLSITMHFTYRDGCWTS